MRYTLKVNRKFCNEGNWSYNKYQPYVTFDTTTSSYYWHNELLPKEQRILVQLSVEAVQEHLRPNIHLAEKIYSEKTHPELFL